MTWDNTLTQTFNIHYPIIQAPMLGVSTPEMAAAVSNQGGLGSLAVGGLSPEVTRQLIQRTKSLTNKPFAVNLFVHDIPAYTERELEPMRKLLLHLAHKRGYMLDASDLSNFKLHTYHDQLDILLEEEIKPVSFTFGCLDTASIKRLKAKGCVLMGTATSREEALFLKQQNIDTIIVQGIEAGGHRGTFLEHAILPQIGLTTLLSQIVPAVDLPCIAAGAINKAKTMKAAFDLGAVAVQIGTAFIGTQESEAIPSYKIKLEKTKDSDTALTKAFSGRWARGIRNELMNEIEQAGIAIPPYPLQNSLTGKLRKLAQQNNDAGYTNLWAGENRIAGNSTSSSAVFMKLVKEYESLSII